MRITFVTRKFGNVKRNSHCDVLHITPIRVARLFLDCNGDFAIKAYRHAGWQIDHRRDHTTAFIVSHPKDTDIPLYTVYKSYLKPAFNGAYFAALFFAARVNNSSAGNPFP